MGRSGLMRWRESHSGMTLDEVGQCGTHVIKCWTDIGDGGADFRLIGWSIDGRSRLVWSAVGTRLLRHSGRCCSSRAQEQGVVRSSPSHDLARRENTQAQHSGWLLASGEQRNGNGTRKLEIGSTDGNATMRLIDEPSDHNLGQQMTQYSRHTQYVRWSWDGDQDDDEMVTQMVTGRRDQDARLSTIEEPILKEMTILAKFRFRILSLTPLFFLRLALSWDLSRWSCTSTRREKPPHPKP